MLWLGCVVMASWCMVLVVTEAVPRLVSSALPFCCAFLEVLAALFKMFAML